MSQGPRRGRPTLQEARAIEDQLRTAALDAFLTNGFDGTTMEAVASAAGVTKRTLYAKYPDERALFATVVPWALSRMPTDAELDLPEDDLEAALRILSKHVLTRLVDAQAVRLRRLALLEAHRFPEFAHAANLQMWRQNVQWIVDLLAAHADAGTIVVDDVEASADLFMALVAGAPTMLADLGVFFSRREQERHIDQAVHLFLVGVLPRT